MATDPQLRRILEAVRLVEAEGLAELEVGDAEFWVRVVGASAESGSVAEESSVEEAQEGEEQVGLEEAGAGVRAEEVAEEEPRAEHQLRSPMNGVYYATPAPGADSYVAVGDFVEAGQVVCLIEAMKTFNEVTAEWAGNVVAILVEHEQQVREGEPLMVIEPEAEEA
jgi:acetyl-CoA carboxylase biotin carboxyl carrier protein